ncbi:MAG: Re/Si-specific NAD(P)(+) transhydrogenase subunit alpha [Chlorobi bacterium]|nr:Re/Si-specific NAD(P)(+) transhydrogenase subunit alpha [Chlorobiota bacterium]
MKIGVIKETRPGEKRVAVTPQVAKDFIARGFEVVAEHNAGLDSHFTDEDYEKVGVKVTDKENVFKEADIIVKVNPPSEDDLPYFREGQVFIGLLFPYNNPDLVKKLADKKVTAFAMELIPRISRAQNMDVLSSQSNLAGYKAVIIGADALEKIFPLMMTAAGTIRPARVLIYGVGVAGLQAIATAKRLGAVVEATDIRPETKEEAESLGAKFLQVDVGNKDISEGGYAKEASEEILRKQRELVDKSLFNADLVITTALVMGRKAPRLITEEQIKQMKRGAVIVDMAVEQGGNVELSQPDKIVEKHGVTIIGKTNLPSLLAVNASELYAKNIYNFINFLVKDGKLHIDKEDEIIKGTLVIENGNILKQ